MKKAINLGLAAVLFMGLFVGMGSSDAANAVPKGADTVLDNQSGLSLFSCAATRSSSPAPNNTSWTVNHSHEIAAESVSGHIIAFDCETYNPANLQQGCVHRTYYVLDNKPDGTDLGIIGPVSRVCWS